MGKLERLPRIACTVAFLMAGLVILSGLLGPILLIPFAVIPLASGIGILRKRVWSAYGLATFLFAQLLLLPLILISSAYPPGHLSRSIFSSLFSLLLGVLFLFAGRSLAASGAARGRAFPWIVLAGLSVAPFFFVHTFEIPSGAMEPTLLPGDRIFAVTFPIYPPERGTLVLFRSPQDRSLILIKRVIAVGGDHIHIAHRVVILNGLALDEKYALHTTSDPGFYADSLPNEASLPGCEEGHLLLSQHTVNGEIVVPDRAYFVLGDNRENSLDSRCWGFVSANDLIGKPWVIYDSIKKTGGQASDPDQNWMGSRRWERLFKVI